MPNPVAKAQDILNDLEKREKAVQKMEDEARGLKTDITTLRMRKGQFAKQLENIETKKEVARAELAKIESERLHVASQKVKESDGLALAIAAQKDQLKPLVLQRKNLETEIADRKKYQKEQEKVIEEMIEKGSDEMANLNYEIKELYRRKDVELAESKKIESEKNDLARQVDGLLRKVNVLHDTYEHHSSNYRQELDRIKSQIESARTEYEMTVKKAREIIERLKAKEKELDVRQEVLDGVEDRLAREQAHQISKRRLAAM